MVRRTYIRSGWLGIMACELDIPMSRDVVSADNYLSCSLRL